MHPRLSIITINYNNVAGIKKTFESVFVQSFKSFEYLVIDGGSSDGSKEIIKKAADQINYFVCESDNGIYHAMNKGIKKATGEYVLFLNSGDHLVHKNILEEVIDELDSTEIIYGNIMLIESELKSWTGVYPAILSFQHFLDGSLPHSSSFIKRTLFEKVGYYDEHLKIVSDWKFYIDAICRHNVSYKHIDKTISVFYLDGLSSLPQNKAVLQHEKEKVFKDDYAMFIDNSKELKMLRAFKQNKAINRFVKIAKVLRLYKDYHTADG